jgi:hypothetical protein
VKTEKHTVEPALVRSCRLQDEPAM